MRRILTVLSDSALILTMLLSAHEVIDLPLGWKGVWYMILFSIALGIWTTKKQN